jgi:uncharacterized protein
MNAPNAGSPLTDQDIETLDARLADIDPDHSMVVEELDGFFAALACCPQPVPREEWLALVLGESPRAAVAARGEGADASLLKLIERHRAAVAGMLYDAQGFAPVLSHDEQGRPWGHAWAIGFARGMALRPDAWGPLEDDDELADALEPVMRLVADAHRDAEDDEASPEGAFEDREAARDTSTAEDDEDYEPIAEDERESVIHDMLDGVQDAYDFFREARARALAPATQRRGLPKIGRNDPCTCGSGRKFKNCCGLACGAGRFRY